MTALVLAEHDNHSLRPSTLNTVTAATKAGSDVHLLVVGHNASDAARQCFRGAFPPWSISSDSETAEAARGAATIRGGWRSREGCVMCQRSMAHGWSSFGLVISSSG